MNPFEAVMIVSSTSLLVVSAGLLIIRTMPSKPGVAWWIGASFLQALAYFLALIFFDKEQTNDGQIVFFSVQLISNQATSLGILRFTDTPVNMRIRMLFLTFVIGLITLLLTSGYTMLAELIVVGYCSFSFFQAASVIYYYKDSGFFLKLAGCFCLGIGLHWLDYPILGKIEWFVPIGFLIGVVLALGLFFTLATIAMLQFKKITNDSEKKAIHAAIHDPLTGVYNRSHLLALFDKYKNEVKKSEGTFIMLYLDLDGFKAVNDTYGHKAGDVILKVVTKRLKSWLGSKGDVIRIGGDELVVINSLRSDTNTNMIYGTSAAQRMLKLIEEPIVDGANTYNISASIGGCYYDSEFNEMEKMLSRTDELMYSAKQAGKRRVHFGNIPDTKFVTKPASDTAESPDLVKELSSSATS